MSFYKSSKSWFVAIVFFSLLSPMLLNLSTRGVAKLTPQGQEKSVDLIVVLGRGSNKRAERALAASQLWRDRQTARVFISGMTDVRPIFELLVAMGVPEKQISGEGCSQTTWENGLFSKVSLDSYKAKRILLVTDEPHLLRAFLVFEGFGFEVVAHGVTSDPTHPFSLRAARVALREYAALLAYGVRGKFHAKPVMEQHADRAKAENIIDAWQCQL